MIAITGASGNLGKATIQFLSQQVSPTNIVAIVRNPERVHDFKEQGIIVRQADYNNYETLLEAFKGVEKALHISTIGVDLKTAKQQEKNVVNALLENNVKHIVYTSMVQTQANRIFEGTKTSYETEKLIKGTKIPYSFLRNSMYMEAIPELIGDALQSGEIRYPSGEGKISFVSRMDIAEAIVKVLTESTHDNQIYEITGNKAYSFDELAKLIFTEKGIPVQHSNISEEFFRKELTSYRMPPEIVNLLVSMANGIKIGEFSYVDNTLEKLLGRKPLILNEFIKII